MGMHLMLTIGKESVYGSDLPDFMVWNQVKELPLFWKPFYSFPCRCPWRHPGADPLRAGLRVSGLSKPHQRASTMIITQALALVAWLVFNRNETNLGGTNGLTDFKQLLGFRLSDAGTQRALYVLTGPLPGRRLFAVPVDHPLTGRTVLIAVRDSEPRVVFSGYTPANYKLFVFVVAAALAGSAGMLYVPQVGIITPAHNRGPALVGNGDLGGGGRPRDTGRSGAGGGQRQFRPQCAHQLFSRSCGRSSWVGCSWSSSCCFPTD